MSKKGASFRQWLTFDNVAKWALSNGYRLEYRAEFRTYTAERIGLPAGVAIVTHYENLAQAVRYMLGKGKDGIGSFEEYMTVEKHRNPAGKLVF